MDTKHRLLTADEEIDLAMRVAAGRDAQARMAAGDPDDTLPALVADGQAARETLLHHNVRLVYSIASKRSHNDDALDYDDLVQEGLMGLLTAIDKFDWRLGNRLSTYATWWVRQYINRRIENGGTIRGRPNPENYSEKLQNMMALARYVRSLDAPIMGRKGESTNTFGDLVPSDADTEAEVAEAARQQRIKEILYEVLANIPPRQAEILTVYMRGGTLQETAEKVGLSRERIRQIRNGSVKYFVKYKRELEELLR